LGLKSFVDVDTLKHAARLLAFLSQPCHLLKMVACCLLPCLKTWSIFNQLLCRLTGRIHLFSHRVCEANDACSMETSWTQVKEQKLGQRIEMVGITVAVWPGPNGV